MCAVIDLIGLAQGSATFSIKLRGILLPFEMGSEAVGHLQVSFLVGDQDLKQKTKNKNKFGVLSEIKFVGD